MPSKKDKRKAQQQAAKRLAQQERPTLRWLKRKGKKALWRIRQAWRIAWRYLLQPTRRALVGFVVLLAAGAQIYFSAWRMSVMPGETLKVSDPFSTMFVLHNEGEFAMHNITFSCKAHDVVYDSGIKILSTVELESVASNVARLEANARTSAPCWTLSGDEFGRVVRIDASLFVSYRPSFYPFRKRAEYRFIARPNDKGGYSWIPMGSLMQK